MTSEFSWQNSFQPLPCFILYSMAKLAYYSRYLFTSYFCIPIIYDEKDFLCVCVTLLFFFFFFLEKFTRLAGKTSNPDIAETHSLSFSTHPVSLLHLTSPSAWLGIYRLCSFAIKKCLQVKVLVVQLCPILCNPMDCSLPGFSVYGILQARILEWVATSFSKESA